MLHLIFLAAALAVPSTGALKSAEAPTLTDVEWVATPTGMDIAQVFPPDAVAGGKGGAVLLECRADGEGLLQGCQVELEAPTGLEFGAAAMALAPLFRMAPVTRTGEPVAGRTVRIPVVFQLSSGD